VKRTTEKAVRVGCKSNKVPRYWLPQILIPKCANAPVMDHLLPNWNSSVYILPLKMVTF